MAAEVFVPAAGALIAGRYQLRRVIGSGGMGQVWEAYDTQLESACAIKFILDHMAQDASVRSRFAREAKAVAALRSPHAVQILGIGEHCDSLYIAMELLEGETLRARLSRAGRLDEATTLAILQQVGHALEKARVAGIVHRDLKPENIWLWSGHDVFAKILDFGVAKSLLPGNSLQTATGALLGTPYYMSPEQARGNHDVDHRSDLWSLAIIAVECLGGRRPYQSDGLGDLLVKILTTPPPPLSELAPHLPASLGAWWDKALARKPEQRFQTVTELVESLRASLDGPRPRARSEFEPGYAPGHARAATVGWPVVAGSVSPVTGSPPQRPQRRRLLGFALAAGAAVLGSITVWRLSLQEDATSSAPPAPAATPLGEPGGAGPATKTPVAQPASPAGQGVRENGARESPAQREAPVVVRPITENPPGETEPPLPPSSTAQPRSAPSAAEDDELFVREARAAAPEAASKAARAAERAARGIRPPAPKAEPKAAAPKPAPEPPKPAPEPPPKPAAPANDYGF